MNVQIDGKDVIIKELTVGEIRAWLASVIPDPQNPKPIDLLGMTLFADIALSELSLFTGMSTESLDSFRPSELRKLITEITNANSHWAECKKRIVEIGKNIQKPQAVIS